MIIARRTINTTPATAPDMIPVRALPPSVAPTFEVWLSLIMSEGDVSVICGGVVLADSPNVMSTEEWESV